jgi:cell division FtsZ-interacting protein ZapD
MQQLRMTNDLEDAINLAWNNANELLEVLELYDLIPCRSKELETQNNNLKEYAKTIMVALHDYVFYSVRTD